MRSCVRKNLLPIWRFPPHSRSIWKLWIVELLSSPWHQNQIIDNVIYVGVSWTHSHNCTFSHSARKYFIRPMILIVPLSLWGLKPMCCRTPRSLPWLLMHWGPTTTGHQHRCFGQCRINGSLSSTMTDFNYLWHDISIVRNDWNFFFFFVFL